MYNNNNVHKTNWPSSLSCNSEFHPFGIIRQLYTNGKIPEGQVYMPRLEPTAPIHLADRNHVHYPSRHYTIKKKMAQ